LSLGGLILTCGIAASEQVAPPGVTMDRGKSLQAGVTRQVAGRYDVATTRGNDP
jgi:hypothetical protein